jgi:hypothetical protein
MNVKQQVNAYIDRLERRLRLGTLLRGAAILTSVALWTTIALVLVANVRAFSAGTVTASRLALLSAVVAAAAIGLAIPLSRVTRRRATLAAERTFPQFQQRLVTFLEKQAAAEPFLDLLAWDTIALSERAEPEAIAPNRSLLTASGIAVASFAVLAWLIVASPGYVGYGAHLLWTGRHQGGAPLYDLIVSPGDATVRRHSDEIVTAQPIGVLTSQARLFARFQSASKWEPIAMQPQPGRTGYQFVFSSLPESVEYYVEAGPIESRRFTIRVVDQPAVTHIKVTYHFPQWTEMPDAIEERGGDLRALEGTKAELEISTDRPLKDGILALGSGRHIPLAGSDGARYRATIDIENDDLYHLAALDEGQAVRLSEDFFIQARKPNPPEVALVRPGRDYRASPIEEVTLGVRARDDFGLKDVDLHYSINGAAEKVVRILNRAGSKQAAGSTVVALEDFKLVPGDVLSVYATAKDAHTQSQTDITFVQVDPFEREFSQSQQSGGAGGGGAGQGIQPDEISRREKEIIAATFKEAADKKATPKTAGDTAKFLSEVQSTLRAQALSLAGRLQARELSDQNQEFSEFQREMVAAVDAMDPAARSLKQQKWQDAIPSEQKALQHLLRAEATFRRIEVAFGARGGGGGGAGRDLASLFDLELDTAKNQYETQQSASSADRRAQDVNEALEKLDQLARREEELAERRNGSTAQSFEQRWQQEMLQREAEQLRRQVEQLAQAVQAQGANGSADSTGTKASSPPGATGQASQSSSAQQAVDRLRQAEQDMRRAASNPASQADARRAAERLRDAIQLLGGIQSQEAAGRLASMAREGDRLAAEERAEAERVRQLKEGRDRSAPAARKLAEDRQKLADDLSNLESDMRRAARELEQNQRAAADRLRSALDTLDQSDLETHLQRTADWLRTGIDPNSNGTESQIASGLQRLGEQLRSAQQALVQGGRSDSPNAEALLGAVDRLRRQIEALNGERPDYQTSELTRGRPGSEGQPGTPGQPDGQASQRNGGRNLEPGRGADFGLVGGPGARDQYGYGGVDTGNNARTNPSRAAAQPTPAADPERAIQQGVKELNQLRQQAPDDPEIQRQIQELITAMEHLDLRRFPGNPAMIAELHQRLLSGVTTLELQLRRNLGDKQDAQIRSVDPSAIPPGYKDAVADYFRRLSAGGR